MIETSEKIVSFEKIVKYLEKDKGYSGNIISDIEKRKAWIKSEVENLVEFIKSTFASQTDLIKFELVENSFNAIEIFEKSLSSNFAFSSSFNSTKRMIETHLNKRIEILKIDMEERFKAINNLNYELGQYELEASDNAEKLYRHLKEIQIVGNFKICSKYYRLNDEALSLIWEKRLSMKYREIEKLVVNLNPIDDRKDFLLIMLKVKIFSKLDEFLEISTNSSSQFKTFMSLNDHYLSDVNIKIQTLTELCKKQVNDGDYLKLSNNLKYFVKDYDFDRRKLSSIRTSLVEALAKNLSDIKEIFLVFQLNEDFDSSKVEALNEKVNEITLKINEFYNANLYLKEFIEESENLKILEITRTQIKKDFKGVLDRLKEKVLQLNRNLDFSKSVKLINILKKFKLFADVLGDQESINLIQNFNTSVFDNTTKNQQISVSSLDDLVQTDMREKYKTLNNSDDLREFKEQLDRKIVSIFMHELEKAEKLDYAQGNHLLNKCKQIASNHLPFDFKANYIDSLIQNTEQVVESKCLDNELSDKTISMLDDNLLSKYNKFVEKNDQINSKKIEAFFFKQIETNIKDFEKDLSNKNFNACINTHLKTFLSIQNKFVKAFPTLKDLFSERYLPKLNEISNKILNEFKSIISSNLSKETIDTLRNNYELAIKLHKISEEVINGFCEFKDNLLEMNTFFNEIQRRTNESLNAGSIVSNIEVYKFALVLCKLYYEFDSLIGSLPNEHKIWLILDENQIKGSIKEQALRILKGLKQEKLIGDSKNKFKKEYDEYFENLFKKLNDASTINENLASLDFNINNEIDRYVADLLVDINELYNQSDKILDDLLSSVNNESNDGSLSDHENSYKFLNGFYNLNAFKEKSKTSKDSLKIRIKNENFESDFLTKITTKCDEYLKSIHLKSIEIAAQEFCKSKQLSQIFFVYKNKIDSIIDKALNKYIESKGFKAIGALGTSIKSTKIGSIMLTEHKIFESYQRSLFMSKTKLRDIETVIDELNKKNQDINGPELKTFYTKYDEIFKKVVNDNLSSKLNLSNITFEIQKVKLNNDEWNNHISEVLPTLLGNIFALWTLLNAKDFIRMNSENLSSSDSNQYLFQAHPAQILSIARMLGVGYKKTIKNKSNDLSSCLIQIGTGEGKSITLAITAILLTLMGYEVYCVCYSKYLSDRDLAAFKELFDTLNLSQYIHYGTFFEICEQIINEQGDLRKIVEHFILNNEIKLKDSSDGNQRQKILLIDEVDVFFSKDFYGNDYKPCLNLADQTISNLIDFIWSKRHELNSLSINTVESSREYRELCSKLGNEWKTVINSSIHSMISELGSIQSHEYVVKDDKIGYIELDNISFNINYGYKTLFAYYLENEKTRISKQSLDKMKSILIKLGSFSLAEIPKIGFKYILGVTGTLDTLNKKQKEIIENDYSIRLKTLIPSVYGVSKLLFDTKLDVKISNEETYHYSIVEEIKSRIIGKDKEKRAVFVFFENKAELIKFKDCQEFQQYSYQTKILTEEANVDEKKNIVNNSATSNQIVLFTKVFGRGTDFITHDEIVKKSGIHVIQTFLSDELSEETQIKGRTARQGDNGSYSIVLFDKTLEKYQIFQNEISSLEPSEYYRLLNEKRNKLFEDSYNDTIKYVEKLKEKHDLSMDFIKGLEGKIKETVKTYIITQNENYSVNSNSVSKTLILIDGTGSMRKLLEKTKQTLEIMFNRAFKILNNGSKFSIKISIYRNYDAPVSKLLQNSNWESQADNLIQFLQTIYAQYGQGNEAIEIGLWQANQEINLNQVILIGDAGPNNLMEIEKNRRMNLAELQKSVFAEKTNYLDELKKLSSKGVKVNAVYLKNNKSSAQQREDIQILKKISEIGNGKYEYLDLDSANSSQLLIDLITQQVLFSIGGENLVEVYRTTKW